MPDPLAAPNVQPTETEEKPTADLEDNWRNQIADEELRASPALANFKELGSFAKAYVDLKSYQGNSLHIPGEDTNEEQRAEFVNKLIEKVPSVTLRPDPDNAEQTDEFYLSAGMPKESKGYEAPEVELPKGMQENTEKLDVFREWAHGAKLSKSQFKSIMAEVTKADIESTTAAQEAQQEETDALNKEWGAAADERRQAALTIAEKTNAPEGLIAALKDGNLSAELTKWVHGLSVAIGTGEGTNLINNLQTKVGALTPDEAQEKIDEIYGNKEHPFHRGDKKAMSKMIELVGQANPGTSTDVNDLRSGGSYG